MKQILIASLLMIGTSGICNAEMHWVTNPGAEISAESSLYVNNRAPLKATPFIKLPPQSIKPGGWVKRYLELQRDGLTGHLGEISAWLDKKGNAWLETGGDHGWEEVPYWLRGYSNMAYILEDEAMKAEALTWIEAILASSDSTGYFGPVNEREGRRELWANMLAMQILQDWYEYSGDERVIDVMSKYAAWQLAYPEEMFLKDYWENSRGGDNLLSIMWLYNRTGEESLIDLMHKIHACTANWHQDTSLPNWHNVNIAECFREPAEYYILTGDSAMLHATYNDYDLIRRTFGQVPGGMFGADENARMGYIDPRQGTETCGFVEQMLSDEILMTLTGDPFWAENLEDVAFNSYPAAVLPDFKSLRYITSPNMVVSDAENHNPGIDNSGPFLAMNPFSSRCCQHNHAMGWPYYSQNLVLASADGGVGLMTYSECTAEMLVGNGEQLTLRETTNYPFDENVKLEMTLSSPTRFPLYLRIPSWAKGATVSVNGDVRELDRIGEMLCIDREWNTGDVVALHFPMALDMRRWQVNQNSISVDYGPLTLSLKIDERYERKNSRESAIWDSRWQEGVDDSQWPTYEIYPASAWNYALLPELADMQIEIGEWPDDNFPWTHSSVPLRVKAQGRKVPSWKIDTTGLCGVLPDSKAEQGELEEITLVPMGASRLRISSFPEARQK